MDEKSRQQINRVLADSERPLSPGGSEPVEPDLPDDRRRNFRTPNFSRMRTSWRGEDRIVIEEIKVQAEKVMRSQFGGAFALMDRLYLLVREPEISPDGTMKTGPDGRPTWKVHDNGSPVENWLRISDRERLQYLQEITGRLFEWEQVAAGLWGEAMLAKVAWEERFADGFQNVPGKSTVDDKAQAGVTHSLDERYFGVFKSILSRRADALVRAMTRLEQILMQVTKT
jgi:hypothetical protein